MRAVVKPSRLCVQWLSGLLQQASQGAAVENQIQTALLSCFLRDVLMLCIKHEGSAGRRAEELMFRSAEAWALTHFPVYSTSLVFLSPDSPSTQSCAQPFLQHLVQL